MGRLDHGDILTLSKNFVITYLKRTKKQKSIHGDIVNQSIKSVTSIGANLHEANGAISKREFRRILYIVRREINETKYWFEVITCAYEVVIPKEIDNEFERISKITYGILKKTQ